MPKGPRGQKVIGNAIKVPRIATGELKDEGKDAAAVSLGKRGGRARADKLSPARRKKIAKDAADARWKK